MSTWVRKQDGTDEWYYGSGSITTVDSIIVNPTDEMLRDAGYEPYVPKPVEPEVYEPTEIEKLETEKRQCYNRMRESDEHALKCMKLGLDFKTTYPSDAETYESARVRYNEIESRLNELYAEANTAIA